MCDIMKAYWMVLLATCHGLRIQKQFQPYKGKYLGTIPSIQNEWTLYAEIFPLGIINNQTGILQASITNEMFVGDLGDRVPRLGFNPNSTELKINYVIGADPNFVFKTKYNLPMREWTKVRLVQENVSKYDRTDYHPIAGTHHFRIYINDELVVDQVNTNAYMFTNVDLWSGPRQQIAANVLVRNLYYGDNPDFDPTIDVDPSEIEIPSEFPNQCWRLKSSQGPSVEEKYELKTNTKCSMLECGTNFMKVNFISDMFGIDQENDDLPFGDGFAPEWDASKSKWRLQCDFQKCNIHFNQDDDFFYAHFTLTTGMEPFGAGPVSDSGYTGADSITDRQTTLLRLIIHVRPKVTWTCRYDRKIHVSTDTSLMDIANVQGFSLEIHETESLTGLHQNPYLGDQIVGKVRWSVVYGGAKFYIRECHLQEGDQSVALVKDNCYSKTLDVSFIDQEGTGHLVEQCSTFKFRPVKFADTENAVRIAKGTQDLMCTIVICFDDHDCNYNTRNDQCPSSGDDAFWGFTIDGT